MSYFSRLFGRAKEKPVPVAFRRLPRVLPRSGQVGSPPTSHASPAGVDDIDEFVHWGKKLFVTSSNVQAAQYDQSELTLLVWFLDGSLYQYSGVTPHEAISFATAPSKGLWVWQTLRISGTKDGHRKPYIRIA